MLVMLHHRWAGFLDGKVLTDVKKFCSSFSHVMMCSVQSSLKLGVVSGVSIRSDICDVLCYVHDVGLCSIDHPNTCSVELLLKRQGH